MLLAMCGRMDIIRIPTTAEGNQITADASSYYFDALNNRVPTLISGSTTEYVFDTSGRVRSAWSSATTAQAGPGSSPAQRSRLGEQC